MKSKPTKNKNIFGFIIIEFLIGLILLFHKIPDKELNLRTMDISYLQGEITKLSLNVGNRLPIDTASYPHNISYTAA